MANKSVVLYQSIKIRGQWTFRRAVEPLRDLSEGSYYVSYYDGSNKRMDSVGSNIQTALGEFKKKQLELAYTAAGGEVKRHHFDAQTTLELERPNKHNERKKITIALSEYLKDCRDQQGKSGYGLAGRTLETYRYRLSFLAEFGPESYLDEIDASFIRQFRRFLRQHAKDLGDRSCHNVMQTTSTFLLWHNNSTAKSLLKEMSYPPKPVIPYQTDEMSQFFAACSHQEELLFKLFLHSMARDMEVAHCEVRDFKFDRNILHISPKPDRNFRLKGKRSGQAKYGRKVPIPALFMAKMKEFCNGKDSRGLVFANGIGGIEHHFLRRCKTIAKRAGIQNWEEFDLHRWRKTGATRHHEAGVSVRKIQAWLGHESLEVTLAYLGVEDAADEASQEQVNNGALAAFA